MNNLIKKIYLYFFKKKNKDKLDSIIENSINVKDPFIYK